MTTPSLSEARLSDIAASSVQPLLRGAEARVHATYVAEYGVRDDDDALVLHFFPPGYTTDTSVTWTDFQSIHDRLERTILRVFTQWLALPGADALQAGYVPELNSFYVIIPRFQHPDKMGVLDAFFRELETAP